MIAIRMATMTGQNHPRDRLAAVESPLSHSPQLGHEVHWPQCGQRLADSGIDSPQLGQSSKSGSSPCSRSISCGLSLLSSCQLMRSDLRVGSVNENYLRDVFDGLLRPDTTALSANLERQLLQLNAQFNRDHGNQLRHRQ